jgi:hypothetical protein
MSVRAGRDRTRLAIGAALALVALTALALAHGPLADLFERLVGVLQNARQRAGRG